VARRRAGAGQNAKIYRRVRHGISPFPRLLQSHDRARLQSYDREIRKRSRFLRGIEALKR
jgi:hypothetical protein